MDWHEIHGPQIMKLINVGDSLTFLHSCSLTFNVEPAVVLFETFVYDLFPSI